jgi:steroid delta-isomerase-like uncharacterized protein
MKMPMLAALTLTIGSMVACAPADSSTSEEVVLRMIEAVNTRDFDALDEVVSQTVHRYSGATPGLNVTSLDEFKAFLHADLASVPDAMQEINQMFASGDMVALHATYTGTQTGPMGPFPPSGKQLELPFIGLLRVESGKIAEIWVEWDNLNALAQLGHFPPPEMTPEETPDVE